MTVATRLNYTQIEEILDSSSWNAVCMRRTANRDRKEAEPMANETITIVDNRTNQSYTLPIYHGTIRAMDLRQIKTGPDDFGLMTYDPAYMNTAHAIAPLPIWMATVAFCATAATPLNSSPSTALSSRSPTSSCTASCRTRWIWTAGARKSWPTR